MRILILIFLTLSVPLYGQDLEISQLTLGPKAGINFSTLTGPASSTDDISGRLLFHAGGFASAMISDNLGAQVELVFSSQGATEANDFFDSDIRINVNYLNLPILGKVQLIEGLFAYVGPQFGFLISSKGKVLTGRFEGTLEAKDDTKGMDVALVFGGSYQVSSEIIIDARLNAGLMDIRTDEPEFRNLVFQVSVGYILFQP